MQESLWVYDQLHPGSSAYNIPEAWRLEGGLNMEALRAALVFLLHRHETLRTIFRTQAGRSVQQILAPAAFESAFKNLSPRPVFQNELERLMATEAERPFSLPTGPLFRALLYRLEPRCHVLLLNLHHIIADAWSQAVLLRELAAAYNAFATGREPNLPELPIQYVDFACWQREGLKASPPSGENRHSRPAPIRLPRDFCPTGYDAPRAETHFLLFPPELSHQARHFARKREVTPFMVYLAAFQLLLHRITGQEELMIGSPISGRERIETEGLIGFFVHTLPLRVEAGGDPSFDEFLGRVRESVLSTFAQPEIYNSLPPASTSSPGQAGSPYQVVFGLQTVPPADWSMTGLQAQKIELGNGVAKFDWTMLLTETGAGLSVRSEYDASRFHAATMRSFVLAYRALLTGTIADPKRRLSAFSLVPPGELASWPGETPATPAETELEATVVDLFEQQVREHPQSVALQFGGVTLTYAQLDARAGALEARLRQAGATRLCPIGVFLDRSLDLVIALVAVLKAGCVYVPLDTSYPQARLAFMVQDADIRFVIARGAFEASAGTARSLTVIPPTAEESVSPLQHSAEKALPSDPAYVLYTSGSTGTPKGVVVPHRGIVRLVRRPNYVQLSSEETLLLLAPVSFDASTFEIWGALLNGARLVIAPPGALSFEELGRTIREAGVTTLWLTAGLFSQMIDQNLEDLRGLRQLLAGGDVLSVPHVLRAVRELQGCRVINGYGPTENTTFTCCFTVPGNWPGSMPVPIGFPINNTRLYVLDAAFAPVPPGVPGELFVAGDGLALGYLNRPELTAEKFLNLDLKTGAGMERLYRTGDRVRWRPEGCLEFLGRLDQQVKIRGFRVEPGETEAVLASHPGVTSAIVQVETDPRGEPELIAYVQGADPGISMGSLSAFLADRLPRHMLPGRVVKVAQFPLTPNGKIDRSKLVSLPASVPVPEPPVPPGTEMEELVWNIWAEVLCRKEFGVREGFFELGGHSLLAAQVVSRLSHALGAEVPIGLLFEHPTIERLAGFLQEGWRKREQSVPAPVALITEQGPSELLGRLEELSEAELDELLKRPDLNGSLLPE